MIMWIIREHTGIRKECAGAPDSVVRKYELWKDIVFRHGPEKLREFPGFHDEKLKVRHKGERSSRLSLQYRVIYAVDRKIVTVFALEITPHND